MLTGGDLAELTVLRRALHRRPDLSREEEATAAQVVALLEPLSPDQVLTGLGGHGVAAVWQGKAPGPAVMFRAELDGLPIAEAPGPAHRSEVAGKGHLCGHDGHMVLLLGLARLISRDRPAKGRVILMFQPAEEDGSGAAAVMADPRYGAIAPDWAFAIHNMPGLPLGHSALRAGPVNCASEGMVIRLSGKTAHASLPETGLSPAPALARLIPALTALGPGGPPVQGYRLVTVTHASLGVPSFGVAPGAAEIWLTLRGLGDADLAGLRSEAMALACKAAVDHGLGIGFESHDAFAASVNHPEATDRMARALAALGFTYDPGDLPMRGSEDFGRFCKAPTRSAMLFLGAGQDHPALHNPDYDFPDALIAPGVAIFHQLMRDLLGTDI